MKQVLKIKNKPDDVLEIDLRMEDPGNEKLREISEKLMGELANCIRKFQPMFEGEALADHGRVGVEVTFRIISYSTQAVV